MRQCSICVSESREEIDRRLSSGDSIAGIAREFEVSEDSLRRHKQRHTEGSPSMEGIIANVQGELTNAVLMAKTGMSELAVVQAMMSLGYESRHLPNGHEIWWLP